MDSAQTEANITLEKAIRRANLLAAAAEVSQHISRILDIDDLLPKTVDIICNAYNFYYAGVFLIDDAGEFAVLRAGRGEPGRIMMENNHKLAVGGNSMIGAATALNEARISLDVDTEKVWYPNPVLPETRSEMALPLAIGNRMIGAVTVQSTDEAAFSDEDISSLQAMANQLAIALENAYQRRELDKTHAELVRIKTFEAIATATGDAIHWIGNKSEPIRSSVQRIRDDVQMLIALVAVAVNEAPEAVKENPVIELVLQEAVKAHEDNPNLAPLVKRIGKLTTKKLSRQLSLFSILEDLKIIDEAAILILKIKEDLIGPAREQAPRPTMTMDVIKDTITQLNILEGIEVNVTGEEVLPQVLADPVQLNRVFVNLLKNAQEAMEEQQTPRIDIDVKLDDEEEFIVINIQDNGIGIAPERLDKLWISFHTTKGLKGHAGLGLPACRLILEQIGGHISASSVEYKGSTFEVDLPVYEGTEVTETGPTGEGKVLLVDDDDRWCGFAMDALQLGGYEVEATGPSYRVDNYDNFDLIIVDDILSNADSLTVLEGISTAGAISKTIAVSSNPRVERTKDRKLVGIHNLVPKPYSSVMLLTQVKQTLEAINNA